MNPELDINEDIIKMFEPLFEALKPKKIETIKTENYGTDI